MHFKQHRSGGSNRNLNSNSTEFLQSESIDVDPSDKPNVNGNAPDPNHPWTRRVSDFCRSSVKRFDKVPPGVDREKGAD
jgi:hypothetical protein